MSNLTATVVSPTAQASSSGRRRTSPAAPSGSTPITHDSFENYKNIINKDFEKSLQDKESKQTEILSIFLTLFTFISINISIFQKIDSIQIGAYFMLLMTGCSITLVGSLFLISRFSIGRLFVFILGLMIVCFTPLVWHNLPGMSEKEIIKTKLPISNIGTGNFSTGTLFKK